MSEEAILSEELLAELGNDPNAVIVGKKRKQALTEEEKKIKYMPQEELKKFKKLSKKEQKKVLQREKKKERASKLGEYMDIIKANEISQEQRDMLQSSRQLNHTATLREQLTLLLKKERAGIKLTDEELDILYPNRHQGADSDEAEDDDMPAMAVETAKGSINPSSAVSQPPPASNTVPVDSTNSAEGDSLFSFTSLFKPAAAAPPGNSDSEDDARAAKKNSKKKKKKASNDPPAITEVEGPSSSAPIVPPAVSTALVQPEEASTKPVVATEEKKPFSAAGLGKNLLAQFSKIKEQKAAADSTSDDKDRKVSTIFSTEFDYNPQKPHAFVSNVPHHDDTVLAATVTEQSKAVIPKKPLVDDTFYNYRRHMTIERPHQVAMDRMNLPVCQMEQEIVEAVHNHDVIILCGETGSGKSTQVPQFLYEAGYAQDEDHLIGIAQPRRVAVTSTAERVNFEMGSTLPALARQKKLNKHKKNQRKLRQKQRAKGADNGGGADNGDDNDDGAVDDEGADGSDDEALLAQHYPNGRKVGYQIRYDSTTVGSDTRIKFMTDGILLREISQDLLLRKYSVIILDEAHERNVNTDILLGMISRAIPLRKEIAAKEYSKWKTLSPAEQADFATPLTPLKLIIMSATLRVDDFRQERLFNPLPPIIKVDARQYPVTNHFAKRTEIRDYLQETFKKTCQIHERLPAGGVLVFLTGKREILYMCQRLQRALGRKHGRHGGSGARDRRPVASATTAAADGGEADDADDAPLVAMLNNLKQQAATAADGDVGFDGDQVDEIDAGSDVDEDFTDDGDDDYDAMNWDDQRQLADADDRDDESVLSDIDDEDYVKAPAKKQPRDGSDSDEDEDDEEAAAAKLRREMLAKVLGKGATPAADADDEAAKVAEEGDEKAKENATDGDADAAANDSAAVDDAAAPPTIDDAPKLKPWILPLYAMMPAHLQKKVFAPVPKGHRLIVIATNVAETSITIPGIRYVVDSGRCKEKVLASASTGASDDGGAQASVYEAGITRYEVRWISKASADQRAGRAGRTGPGHCYRLFSSNFYHEHMQAFMPPEINVTPLEDIVLHMLSLGITEIESFPFPSNPPRAAVHAAVALLKNLGAIEPETAAMRAKERDARLWALLNQQAQGGRPATTAGDEAIVLGHLSPLGKMLRWFPIHPRFAKMLVIATQTTQAMRDVPARYRLLSHVLTMVATLTERSVFVFDDAEENDDDDDNDDDSDEDDDDSGAGDDDDDEDGGVLRRKRKASSGKQRVAKKAKTSKKEARHAEGRKLFHHASGDVMARLRATGAYLFTLYAALRRLRRERLLAEAAARREQTRQQAAMNVDGDNGGDKAIDGDNDDDDDALSIDTEAERKPFQKWEYDAANQDASVVALCQKFHLHQGTLQRIVDLRNQLQHILQGLYHRLMSATSSAANDDDDDDDELAASFDIVLEPPTTAEETALRQILLSGYCDQIAKRAPFATIEPHLQRLQQQQQQQLHQTPSSPAEKPINFLSRRRKFTAYVSGHPSLQTTGPVYVHPTSNCYAHDITLASETLPEYIVYTHMMKNQRGDCLYLTNVTVVSPQWITDVALTCPLVSIRHSDVMHQLDLASAASCGHGSGAKKPSSSSLAGGKKRRSALSDDEDDDDDADGADDDALVATSSSSTLRGKSIAPFYDEQRECMMLYVKPRYGVHLWTLPTTVLPMRYVLEHWHTGDASSSSTSTTSGALVTGANASSSAMPVGYRMEDLEFRWFARCLLFGQVMFPVPVPQLQRGCLQDVHCIQQSKPHPKLLPVLRRLVEARVASRSALMQQLVQQSNFLAKELEALLKPDQQRGFRVAWMRLSQYAVASAKASPQS